MSIRSIPMDTTMTFLWARGPEPDMDRATGTQKIRDGLPVFKVLVVTLGETFTEVLPIKVKGEPATCAPNTALRVKGLRAVPWTPEQGETQYAYWADSIEAARPERAAS